MAQAPSTRVGGRVRARRESLKLTQDELAQELGITHQHISRIESDQAAPSLDLLVKLARRLGISTDHLLTGQEKAPADIAGAIRGEPLLSAAAKRHLSARTICGGCQGKGRRRAVSIASGGSPEETALGVGRVIGLRSRE
jgi:putative transcriptional regulator